MATSMAERLTSGKDSIQAATEYVNANVEIGINGLLIEVVVAQLIIIGLLIYIAFFKKCNDRL